MITEEEEKNNYSENKNNEYLKNLEKIRKFKERVMAMNNPSPPKVTKNKKKLKLKPIKKPVKEIKDDFEVQIILKEKYIKENLQPKVLPPITDSLYKRLLNPYPIITDIKGKGSSPMEERKNSEVKFDRRNRNIYSSSPLKTEDSLRNIKKLHKSVEIEPKRKVNLVPKVIAVKQQTKFRYTYVIKNGNNGELIEKCMKRRSDDWEKVDSVKKEFINFIWTPLNWEINFSEVTRENLFVNHFEYNSEISNKMKLFANLLRYCDLTKNSPKLFNFFPFTVVVQLTSKTFETQLQAFSTLFNNMEKYKEDNVKDGNGILYNSLFQNYVFSNRVGNSIISFPDTVYKGKNLWLIKPINLNRGRAIQIENNLDQIITQVRELKKTREVEKFPCEYILLQKYIEDPLLYQGRKFDIRLWVMITTDNPNCVYIFKEGHLKATCVKYSINTKDKFTHLTNYSVQKYHEKFSQKEKGNEISFKQFQEELDRTKSGIKFRKKIYPKIVSLVKLSINSGKGRINLFSRRRCFEIFGYDFLIDSNYNPFLIEINTNPGLEESSPLIAMLTPRMIDDAMRLTIDTIISKEYKKSEFHVDGYSDEENLWEKFNL